MTRLPYRFCAAAMLAVLALHGTSSAQKKAGDGEVTENKLTIKVNPATLTVDKDGGSVKIIATRGSPKSKDVPILLEFEAKKGLDIPKATIDKDKNEITVNVKPAMDAALGEYDVKATATAGDDKANASFKVKVVQKAGTEVVGDSTPKFSLRAEPLTIKTSEGKGTGTAIIIAQRTKLTDAIKLTFTKVPEGVKIGADASIKANETTAKVTVEVDTAAKVGTHKITVTGTAKDKTATTELTLTIDARAVPVAKYSRAALLMGYNGKDLQYAEDDAKLLKAALEKSGFEYVEVLTGNDATKDNFRDKLELVSGSVKEGKSGEETIFLVYFAGHGVIANEAQHYSTRDVYVDENGKDRAAPDYEKGVSEKDHVLNVLTRPAKCKASIKLLITDACRKVDDAGAADQAGLRVTYNTNVLRPEAAGDLYIIQSCKPDQVSVEDPGLLKHGVFTHFLVEGLRGGRSYRHPKHVYIEDVIGYVKQKTPDYAGKLTLSGTRATPQEPMAYPEVRTNRKVDLGEARGTQRDGKTVTQEELEAYTWAYGGKLDNCTVEGNLTKVPSFLRVSFKGAKFAKKDDKPVEFDSVFEEADFSGATLTEVKIKNTCIFNNAVFKGATLDRVQIDGDALCFLGVDFTNAKFTGDEHEQTQLKNTRFGVGTVLNKAQFDKANLTGADFNYCKLNGAKFNKAVLDKATMDRQDLSGVEFTDTTLINAKLQFTSFTTSTKLKRTSFKQADLTGAKFAGVDLSELTPDDFDGTILEGAVFTDCPGAQRNLFAKGVGTPKLE